MHRFITVSMLVSAVAFAACSGTGSSPPITDPADAPDASIVVPDGSTTPPAPIPDASAVRDAAGQCHTDAECTAKMGTVIPVGCAAAKCDPTTHACVFTATDGDKDGHGTNRCKATDPSVAIKLGDDCDDTDPNTYPNAWDGPKGEGHPDRCDSLDENCDGVPDNLKLSDGTSCSCKPGDIGQCSQDSTGKPITWPTGSPVGACKYGGMTCLANGTWGPCTDAVGPSTEYCNSIDDDCNGVVDDGPPPDKVPVDAQYWAYDGDDDLHARIPGNGYDKVHACAAPPAAPVACTTGSFASCTLGATPDTCCPANKWKLANALPADDCNDENPAVSPAHAEVCINQTDDNCNGQVDEYCVCQPNTVDHTCGADGNGNPITFPGGAPTGACHYGERTCSADGRAWGGCAGAQGPVSQDICSNPPVDANCDGTVECACTIGTSQKCANQKGACAGSTQTCTSNTGWGPCTYVPPQYDTCDSGNDANCDGTANNGFPNNTSVCACLNGTSQLCGVCNAGVQTCSAGHWGPCSNNGPTNIGQTCNVAGKALGACKNGGTWTCNSATPTSPMCSPASSAIGTNTPSTSAAPNGSYDWNCDGNDETFANLPLSGGGPEGFADITVSSNNAVYIPNPSGDCSGWIGTYQASHCVLGPPNGVITPEVACNTMRVVHTCGVVTSSMWDPANCNVGMSTWACSWNYTTNTCGVASNSYRYATSQCE
jgi:hypothetical protein